VFTNQSTLYSTLTSKLKIVNENLKILNFEFLCSERLIHGLAEMQAFSFALLSVI